MTATTARRPTARVGALAAAAAGAALSLTALAAPAVAAGGAGFTDLQAHGGIGLCSHGRQITSGSVTAAPFVGRAVSTVAAPAGYGGVDRTATLYAYQPLKQVPAGDWSGSQLTASTRYSPAAHPIAATTAGDPSLSSFTTDFKPTWGGLVELRLYFGSPGRPVESQTYPATLIRVTGGTWRVVGTAPKVDCRAGTAVSLETVLLSKRAIEARAAQNAALAARAHPRHHAANRLAAKHPARQAGSTNVHPDATAAADTTQSTPHHGDAPLVVGLVAAALLVAGGSFLTRRHLTAAARSAVDQKGLRP